MAEEFKVLIGAELESGAFDSIKSQINGIKIDPIKLKIDTSSVKSQIDSIKSQIQSIGNIKINLGGSSGGSNVSRMTNEMTKSYRDLMSMAKQISNLEIRIGGLKTAGGNTNQISVLETQLKSLQKTYEQLMNTFASGEKLNTHSLDVGDLSNLQAALDKSKDKLAELDAKVIDTKNKLANDLSLKLDTNQFSVEVATLESNFNKLGTKTTEVSQGVANVKTALNEMKVAAASGDVDGLVTSYERYKTTLKDVSNQIKLAAQAEKEMADAERLAQSKTNLSLQMDVWLKNNSAAASEFGGRIRQLQAELESCDATRLSGIKSEFQALTKQAELAGKATQTFGDRLKDQFAKLGTYLSAAMVFSQISRALRSAFDEVLKVDTAMTELYRVTDLSSTQYTQLYDNMVSSAKAYGAELDSLINSTASWVRLGFDPNDANRLAEITTMYQHVTDLDESTAVNNLVTAYKGFEKQLLELHNGDSTAAVLQIADIYDKLGNEFALSAADVGDGLSKSASVLAQGGASIEEAAGM